MTHYSTPHYHRFGRRAAAGLLLAALVALVLLPAAPAATHADDAACFTLTLVSNPAAGGSITASPPKSDTCTTNGQYAPNATVQLTAEPAAGYTFANWSGHLSGGQNPKSITMDSAKSVTANFSAACYTLTRAVDPEGSGAITADPPKSASCPDNQYTTGTSVTLTAAPNSGYTFDSWSGDLSGPQNPASLTMSGPKSVTARFKQTEYKTYAALVVNHKLTWERIGNELPGLYSFIACPTNRTRRYAGTSSALYRWTGEWATGSWEEMNGAPANVRDFLFVSDENDPCADIYAASYNGGVWRLQGDTWQPVGAEIDKSRNARTLARRDDWLYVGGNDGIYRYDVTAEMPGAWQPVLTGANSTVTRLSAAGDRLYAAVFGFGARYNDTCTTAPCEWTSLPAAPLRDAFDVVGPPSGDPPAWLVLGTVRGIYRWDGTVWQAPAQAPQPLGYVFALAQVDQRLYAGVQNGGVWFSDDQGANWQSAVPPDALLEGRTVVDLVVIEGDGLYAVTSSGGVWRWPLTRP